MRARRAIASGILLLLPSVAAAAPAAIGLAIDGACPDEPALREALSAALPGIRITAADLARPGETVTVSDGGARYRVAVGSSVRDVADPARNCAERARAAAVVAALALDAAALPIADPPPAIPNPPAAIPNPPAAIPNPPAAIPNPPAAIHDPAAPQPWHVDLELGVTGAIAPTVDGAAPGIGGALRGRVSRGAIGATLGVAAYGPQSLQLGDVRAHLVFRVPIDLGIDLALRRPRAELSGQLGAVVAPFEGAGDNLFVNRSGVGIDVAGRIAVELRLRVSGSIWLALAVEGIVTPSPAPLQVAGRGDVGATPRFWLATSAGVSWRVR